MCPRDEEGVVVSAVHVRPVTWELRDNEENCRSVCLPPVGNAYRLRIFGGTEAGDGKITVIAKDCLFPFCESEKPLYLGCEACGGGGSGGASAGDNGQCSAGGASADASSVNFRMFLGGLPGGESAGALGIHARYVRENLADPSGLSHSTRTGTYRWNDTNSDDFQVRSAEVLADVVDGTPDDHAYKVDFYEPNDVSNFSSTTGEWLIKNGHTPAITYEIKDPNTSAELRITQKVDGNVNAIYEYENTETTIDFDWQWTLNVKDPNGVTVRTKSVHDAKDDPNNAADPYWARDITEAEYGGTVTETREVFTELPFGRALTQRIFDPSGLALTTQYLYYTTGPAVGRLKAVIHADGSWKYFEYDNDGRVTLERTPFEDYNGGSIGSGGTPAAGSSRDIRTTYLNDPNVADPNDFRLDSVKEYVQDTLSARADYSYSDDPNGLTITASECTDPSSCTTSLDTITRYMPGDNDKLRWVQSPDDRFSKYVYTQGDYDPGGGAVPDPNGFSTNASGLYERTVITHGTASAHAGVANKTTREKTLTNAAGKIVWRKTLVYNGSSYERIDWTVYSYDERGRLTEVNRLNGTKEETIYASGNCCGAADEFVDAAGIRTLIERDPLGRVRVRTKEGIASGGGYAEQVDLITEIDPNNASGSEVVLTSVYPDGSPGSALVTREEYDRAGRLTESTDPVGLTTTYDYDTGAAGGREVTVTHADDTTEITEYYRDGRIKELSGTSVVRQLYDYGVNGDGTTWTKIYTGPNGLSEVRYVKTTYDALGRVKKEERPAFGGGVITAEYTYDADGRLSKTQTSDAGGLVQAPTIYEYDELGNLERTGLDCNNDGDLDDASLDRITETVQTYQKSGSDWWRKTTTSVYATDNSGAATTVDKQRVRLTGFGTNEIAETEVVDIYGQAITTSTVLDRANKLLTATTTFPGTGNTAVQVTRNGLLQSAKGKDQLTTTFGYDGFGRRTTVTDSRGNVTETHYDAYGRVDWVEDGGDNRTTYDYYAATGTNAGRLKSVKVNDGTNDNYTRYSYTSRGEVEKVWGDAPQPVYFEYDDYGQRTKLHTYRGEPSSGAWSDATWPTPAAADTTQWDYDGATGLLESKTYADDTHVDYDYTPDGKLAERTWARQSGGNPLTTTYSYYDDPSSQSEAAGELHTVNYSDSTPDVTYTYTRLGKLDSVADVLGTRSFTYSTRLEPATETFGSGALNGKRISTDYQDAVSYQPPGQPYPQLFSFTRLESLQVGTSGDPDADYLASYDFSGDTDRMSKVTAGPGLPAGGAVYAYETNSPLVNTIQYKDASSVLGTVDFAYEANRDLVQSVTNYWGGTEPNDVASKYAYVNDSLARRTSVVRTGNAFDGTGGASDEHADVWSYNRRNELVESERFEDTSAPFDQNNVPGLDREYVYDPIGNRKSYIEGTAATKYYCSNELNQYDTIDDDASDCPPTGGADETLSYDADGNLTADGGTMGASAGRAFTWDAENRLLSVAPMSAANGDKKVEFEYDYMNRRVSKKVSSYNGTSWSVTDHRRFVYHGWLLLLELDAEDSNAVLKKYTWGLDIAGQRGNPESIDAAAGISGLVATLDTQGTPSAGDDKSYAYFYDANGNVGQLVDTGDGSLDARYEYDAYGAVLVSLGSYASDNPIRFSTKYEDDETDLLYYGERYMGRGWWLSRDILFEARDVALYRFLRNRPVVNIDPHGAQSHGQGPDFRQRLELAEHLIELIATWRRAGFHFSADLLAIFLSGDKTREHDLSRHSSTIQHNAEYREGLRDFIESELPRTICEPEHIRLPDRYPVPTNEAFDVEFAGIGDMNPFDVTSGTDLTWALGTGHFGFRNASLTIEPDGANIFGCCFRVLFSGLMTQRDFYSFPRGIREFFHEYSDAARLQHDHGLLPFWHHEEWQESMALRCCKEHFGAVYPLGLRWRCEEER